MEENSIPILSLEDMRCIQHLGKSQAVENRRTIRSNMGRQDEVRFTSYGVVRREKPVLLMELITWALYQFSMLHDKLPQTWCLKTITIF